MSILADAKNIKALALDLDGTLLAPGSVLTERTVRAIKTCRRRGLKIIIATGRAIEATLPIITALGADGPVICYNGAAVADMPGAKILSTTLLARDAAAFCVDLSRETGVYYQIFVPCGNLSNGNLSDTDKKGGRIVLMAEQDAPEREMYYKHTGILAELCDLKEVLGCREVPGCVKTMFMAEPEVQTALRSRLNEHFGKNIYITRTLYNFLEIMDVKVSKGQGLKFAMEHYGIKSEEVIAFGDEENDLPMFAAAGFSAAPLNAKDTVKAAANLVIGSNAEDGVAVFLEEFFG